ncbi:hypothetical protein [Marinobacter alkaliphilus]|uniref:DUF4388 domain-containing protein n=1 Tax=Marinobacter alkaliphilus TaxID=254719 RepID=A0ABZ3EB10_9GAMM
MSIQRRHTAQQLGDCFKVAAELALPVLGRQSRHLDGLTDIQLVHGIVSGQGKLSGLRFTHAWVEGLDDNGVKYVVDASNGREVALPSDLYYLIGKISPSECVRFTPEQARRHLLDAGHYGPWCGAPFEHEDPVPGVAA